MRPLCNEYLHYHVTMAYGKISQWCDENGQSTLKMQNP